MGLDVNEVAQNLGISVEQARKLDGLDGNNKDGVSASIYDMAKLALAKDQESKNLYREGLEKDGANLEMLPMVEQILLGKVQEAEPKEPLPPEQDLPKDEPKQFYGEQVKFEMKKPPEAIDYDYNTFFVTDRDNAIDEMGKAIKEILELVTEYNINHYPPLTPDIKEMLPDPAKYTAKKCGNKKEAYRVWQKELERRVESFKDNIKELSNANDNMRFNQLINAMTQLYIQQGLTRDEIQDVVVRLNGNTQEIKDTLNRRAREINGHINQAESDLHHHIGEAVNNVNRQTERSEKRLHESISAHTNEVNENIDGLSKKIDANKKEEQKKAKLRKELGIAWQNKPARFEKILREFLDEKGYKFDRSGKLPLSVIPSLNPSVGDRDNNAIQSVIENLSLSDLQQLRNRLITPAKDPFVH